MSDTKFYTEINLLFESYLSKKEDKLKIRVKSVEKNSILSETDMNYNKVFFDADMNIYKIDADGKLTRIESDKFETVIVKEQ